MKIIRALCTTSTFLGGLAGACVWAVIALATVAVSADPVSALLAPSGLAWAFAPIAVGGFSGVASWSLRSLRSELSVTRAQLARQKEKRRTMVDELSQLHSLELSTLADLEECEAELTARGEVMCSLGEAVRDALYAVDNDLDSLRVQAHDEHTGHIAHISQQVGDLMDLVQDATQFATDECTDERPPLFRLVEVVARAARKTTRRLQLTQVVSWSLDESAPAWVHGDPDRLEGMIGALILDAHQSGMDPVHLDLAPVSNGGTVGLRIACGAATEQERGLGFSARLAEAMGQPPIYTSLARSGVFWFQESVQATGQHSAVPEGRVLVASDMPATRARLRRLLSRWGCEVDVARSKNEAMAVLNDAIEPFDVMILDLHESSLETLRDVRTSSHSELPVLVLSPDLENLVVLHPEGDPRLTQPVRQDTLLEGVQQVIEPRWSSIDAQPAQGSGHRGMNPAAR